jgi:uncharacterized membrane protein
MRTQQHDKGNVPNKGGNMVSLHGRLRGRPATILAALMLAVLAMVPSATARPKSEQATPPAQEPPPISCIPDSPMGPLGPGYLRDRGKFTTIDHPDATLETVPGGINNRGQIVGSYDTPGFIVRGFLLDQGRYETINFPGSLRTIALRINARGQILGNYEDARGGCHGFLLDKGEFTRIDFPGVATQALGLNDKGQAVGAIEVGGGRVRAFLFDRGDYSIIDVPGAGNASAVDINNRRQIVGAYRDSDGMTHGYFLDDGELTNVEVPGALVTMPLGINNKGHVAGFYIDADLGDALVAHGFLYRNGTYVTIDHPLAFTGTSSYDVSDNGQIVGFYDRAASRAMEAGSAERQSLGPAALEMWGPGRSQDTRLRL